MQAQDLFFLFVNKLYLVSSHCFVEIDDIWFHFSSRLLHNKILERSMGGGRAGGEYLYKAQMNILQCPLNLILNY